MRQLDARSSSDEVRIIQMRVERPRFRFDIADLSGRAAGSGGGWRADPERISLGRLEIVDGSALIDAVVARQLVARGIADRRVLELPPVEDGDGEAVAA